MSSHTHTHTRIVQLKHGDRVVLFAGFVCSRRANDCEGWPIGIKQINNQTNKQANKQTSKQTNDSSD
jgi:hypothetical protein